MRSTFTRRVISRSCRPRNSSNASWFTSSSTITSTSTNTGVDRPCQRQQQQQHQRTRRCLSTYYDSQSGLHIPVHNEMEISLILDVRKFETPFVVHNLNKDRLEAEEMQEKLQTLTQQGIRGTILPSIQFPRDVRNLQTLSVIAPPCFGIVLDAGESTNTSKTSTTSTSTTVDDGLWKAKELSSNPLLLSKVLKYKEGFERRLQSSVEKGLHTTLSVDIGGASQSEPIALANTIASKIDANGGCDYIWIQNNGDDADTMVQMCEELVYLDVAGPTIKSRLLVNALNEDVVEDCMFAGVNKYVIDSEDQVELVERVAREQGKALLRT